MNDLLALFLTFLKASTLGLGGFGSLPFVREDLILTGRASDEQLVQALAVGRLGTGPNALYLVSFGYLIAGLGGALAALVAQCLPPLVMLPAAAAARRWLMSTLLAGLVRGASLATAGLLLAIGIALLAPDVPSLPRVPAWQLALAAAAAAVTLVGRLHPGILILAGAAAGVALAR